MTDGADELPVAYITLGGAGSGKSTLSQRLSAETGAVYLDKDTIAGPLVRVALDALGQDPSDRESNGVYVSAIMPAEYETLFAAAGTNLALGHSVVLDAPFVAYLDDPGFLSRSIARAGWPPSRIQVIRVRASPEVVRRRLVERGSERDRVKLADWDGYWARFGVVACRWEGMEIIDFWNEGAEALDRIVELAAPGGRAETAADHSRPSA